LRSRRGDRSTFVAKEFAKKGRVQSSVLRKDVQGAVIAEIDADSPAGKQGLRQGDVIQEVNKQPVKNAKDLVGISKKLKTNEENSAARPQPGPQRLCRAGTQLTMGIQASCL
jgi:S1-C subfamily serine protease